MPIYEYLCHKCKTTFTEIIRLTEIETYKPVCPKCNSKNVKKQLCTFHAKTRKKY
jgi:putative FmdB family regulatory protein